MFWIHGGFLGGLKLNFAGGSWGCSEVLEVMFQTRSLLKTVTCVFLIHTISHAALLPGSLNISIQSENMRHVLTWSSLQDVCCSVNYTVKYQGEFEYMQNNSWQDEHSCSEIVQTECDLSLALSSDSDYNISVVARCGDSTLRTQLPKTFNRRDTVLLAPNLSVNLRAGHINIFFSELQHHISIKLKMWKEGDEQNVFSKEIKNPKLVQGAWGGGRYCLKAEATLDIANKTNSTDTLCVTVPEPEPSWSILLAVGVAVALTLAVALVLGFITPRCSHWLQKFVHSKDPLPDALLSWPESPSVLSSKILLEPTHSISLLDPSDELEGNV